MRALSLSVALLLAVPAHAQTFDPAELAQVVASTKVCEIEIAEARVEQWLRANASKLDLKQLAQFKAAQDTVEAALVDLTPEEVAQHCVRIRDLAKTFGMVE